MRFLSKKVADIRIQHVIFMDLMGIFHGLISPAPIEGVFELGWASKTPSMGRNGQRVETMVPLAPK